MATITQETRVTLRNREAVALGRLGGHVVECLRGEVWLTADGEGRDVILAPGLKWRAESDSPVVVSALAPSQLRIRQSIRTRGFLRALRMLLSLPPCLPHLSSR